MSKSKQTNSKEVITKPEINMNDLEDIFGEEIVNDKAKEEQIASVAVAEIKEEKPTSDAEEALLKIWGLNKTKKVKTNRAKAEEIIVPIDDTITKCKVGRTGAGKYYGFASIKEKPVGSKTSVIVKVGGKTKEEAKNNLFKLIDKHFTPKNGEPRTKYLADYTHLFTMADAEHEAIYLELNELVEK